VPARSKMVGVWETVEGERVPPPRRPHPSWRYPHGPQHGETLEKSRTRLPTRYRHARTPPGGGGGGAPQARVGWGRPARYPGIRQRRHGWGGGCRQKCMGIPCRRRGRGGGCQQKCMVSPRRRGWGVGMITCGALQMGITPQARVGWGCRKSTGIPKEARAGWGSPTRYPGIPPRRRGRGGGCRQKGTGIPAKARAWVGEAGRRIWVSLRRRGRGIAGELRMRGQAGWNPRYGDDQRGTPGSGTPPRG